MGEQWVYFFGQGHSEGDPQRKDLLGGKGASLAAMSRAGLPVPPGFTISTECCRAFLDSDGRWPEGLREQVREYIRRLEEATGRRFGQGPDPLLVSVRSGAAVSMPGMMDTILNCGLSPEMAESATDGRGFWRVYAQFVEMFARTVAGIDPRRWERLRAEILPRADEDAATAEDYRRLAEAGRRLYAQVAGREFPTTAWESLVQCIEAVFRSWNNERAVTYRREHDIRGCEGTAVNVQSMFPSEISGIVFTTNPNDLAAGEMIIESSYGLGEAVVSGDVHPDTFSVDRETLEIKRSVIGHKARMVSALGAATPRDPDAPSLSDEQVRALAEMALKVERFFGFPVDLEWGWAQGQFALLQARAIRGLEVVKDVEIGRMEEVRRLREIAGDRRKVWVRHNLSETLPFPTPLTWDIVRRFMSGDGGFGRMYRDFGYRPSPRVCREGFLELICGRVYADPERAAELFWNGMPLTYDLDEVLANPAVIDTAPTRFQAEKADGRFLLALPGLLRDMIRCWRRMRRLRRCVLDRFEQEVLPAYLQWVRRTRAEDLTRLSTTELLDALGERTARVLDEFGGESLKPGFFGGLARARLEGLLVQLMGPEEGARLSMDLCQGLDGDVTVEQNTCLYRVARGQLGLEEFLERFGHRAVEEMELSRPRWREDPTYVQRILGAYLNESVPSPEQRHRDNVARRQAAQRRLPETLRQWGGSCLMEDVAAELADAQRMLPYRENGKHYLMMGYETIRQVLVELGRRWNLGRDVFFLKFDELGAYENAPQRYAERIGTRKVRWLSAKRLELPDVIDSNELESLGLPRQYDAAAELTGEPIAPGVATGTARIVFDPEQAADASTDYVLVCPSTDPGWTALFVQARALVVEQGGMLSHGAIVARDFGIPAVVCRDATRRIPEGTTIRVDGNRGRIDLLEQAP